MKTNFTYLPPTYFPPVDDIDVGRLASQLVQLPSVNPMGGPIDAESSFEFRVTDYLETLLGHWGIACQRYTVHEATDTSPARENLVAALETDNVAGPHLLYEVHQDTVPVQGMRIDPWGGTLRDGCVWGRGSCDIKGGMASMLVALARLSQLPRSVRPHLIVAFTINEEHGFSGASALVDYYSGTPDPLGRTATLLTGPPTVSVVAEPTLLQVVVAHKGTVRWRCHTRGRAAHSSAPEKGENAVYAMAYVLQALERYARDVVPQLPSHALLGQPTLSVGMIAGGVSVNTVPDSCAIDIDRRLLPGESPDEAYQHAIEYLQSQLPPHVQVKHAPPLLSAPGLTDTHNGPLAARLVAAAEACGHASAPIGVPYGTDAATFAAHGVPTVVFGPGDVAQAHTADEWVAIDQLAAAADIYTQFARDFTSP